MIILADTLLVKKDSLPILPKPKIEGDSVLPQETSVPKEKTDSATEKSVSIQKTAQETVSVNKPNEQEEKSANQAKDSAVTLAVKMNSLSKDTLVQRIDETVAVTEVGPPFRDGIKHIERESPNQDWLFYSIFMVCVVMGWARWSNGRKLKQLIDAFMYDRFVQQLLREDNVFFSRLYLKLLYVNYIVTGSFIYIVSSHFFGDKVDFSQSTALNHGLFIFAVFAASSLKSFLVKMLGLSFDQPEELNIYNFYKFLFSSISGMVLIPFLLLTLYASAGNIYFMYSGIIIYCFIHLFKIVKTTYLSLIKTTFSPFHIILYICTLEIFPLVVLIKVFTLYY